MEVHDDRETEFKYILIRTEKRGFRNRKEKVTIILIIVIRRPSVRLLAITVI